MKIDLKRLLARGPEIILAERVFIREWPLEEIGLTLFYIAFAATWIVISEDVFEWAMGHKMEWHALHMLRAINFVFTTGLVLYVVLRRNFYKRRRAEEAMRISHRRFELVALATTDAIWEINLETNVVWWGDGIQKLFGYRAGDVSSKLEWWLERVHPEDRQRVTTSILGIVESGGHHWSNEYRFRRQDGTYAIVWGRGSIICDAAGKPTRLVGGISDISERRLAEKAIENSRQQLRALTARLQTSREEERAKAAREIHDDLGQILTALKLNLDWLERKIGEQKDADWLNPLLDRVMESEEMVGTAIQSVQRIAADLRPAVLDDLGLAAALREEARRFLARSSIQCELQLPDEQVTFPPGISTAIFRVFQEALTNVARHAEATTVQGSLEIRGDQVFLQLEDNGKGIPLEALSDPHSLGLLGMAERASAHGGSITVAPVNPHGTRVTLQLPLQAGDGKDTQTYDQNPHGR
jgi:two-component system sensor histidine kinase UhpB